MQKTYSKLNVKTISGTATLITTLIIVTPLCGLIFQCGCDWPWSGLDAGCNFYKPEADHQCPWCASMITGIFSTGLAIISGISTAMAPLPLAIVRPVNEFAVRTLLGLTVFVLVAILTAGLAALWQNYPLGVGGFLRYFVLMQVSGTIAIGQGQPSAIDTELSLDTIRKLFLCVFARYPA